MTTPASIRFSPDVLRRLTAHVAAHPGTSISSATTRLVDEALRSEEHPMIVFRDGPAGRRARLASGPDVWQLIRAVRSARATEPNISAPEVRALVSETTGVAAHLVAAAISYWAAFPMEIDATIEQADIEERESYEQWAREQGLLAG